MRQSVQTYRLYLAARPTRRTAGVVIGFLLVRGFKATSARTPTVISLWPSERMFEGKSCIVPKVTRHNTLSMDDVRGLMVLEYSLPVDAFHIELPAVPVGSGSFSLQELNWSYNVFMRLALAGRFDMQATPLSWANIVDCMRNAVRLPPSPIPTFNLNGERVDAFTLPPPYIRASEVEAGPANPYREEWIRRPPPSPIMSEDQWSTCGTIGKGKKYRPDSSHLSAHESSSTHQQDHRVLRRTTTHHRSSHEKGKENVDVRAYRRHTRKVPKPEPMPEVVKNAPHHRDAAQPRSILKSRSKPYTRFEATEQAGAGGWTPQRVGIDLHAPRYYAEPEHGRGRTSRSRARDTREERYAKAEEQVKRRSSKAARAS
ncbi:unnamed protein product [Peniophora sp. CBMAI 1063]|nr:unnamed protein product [Peniophora sp. CBMAI 1063]